MKKLPVDFVDELTVEYEWKEHATNALQCSGLMSYTYVGKEKQDGEQMAWYSNSCPEMDFIFHIQVENPFIIIRRDKWTKKK